MNNWTLNLTDLSTRFNRLNTQNQNFNPNFTLISTHVSVVWFSPPPVFISPLHTHRYKRISNGPSGHVAGIAIARFHMHVRLAVPITIASSTGLSEQGFGFGFLFSCSTTILLLFCNSMRIWWRNLIMPSGLGNISPECKSFYLLKWIRVELMWCWRL